MWLNILIAFAECSLVVGVIWTVTQLIDRYRYSNKQYKLIAEWTAFADSMDYTVSEEPITNAELQLLLCFSESGWRLPSHAEMFMISAIDADIPRGTLIWTRVPGVNEGAAARFYVGLVPISHVRYDSYIWYEVLNNSEFYAPGYYDGCNDMLYYSTGVARVCLIKDKQKELTDV